MLLDNLNTEFTKALDRLNDFIKAYPEFTQANYNLDLMFSFKTTSGTRVEHLTHLDSGNEDVLIQEADRNYIVPVSGVVESPSKGTMVQLPINFEGDSNG